MISSSISPWRLNTDLEQSLLICHSSLDFDSFMPSFGFSFDGVKVFSMLSLYSTKEFCNNSILKSSLSSEMSLIWQNIWWAPKPQSSLHNLLERHCTWLLSPFLFLFICSSYSVTNSLGCWNVRWPVRAASSRLPEKH